MCLVRVRAYKRARTHVRSGSDRHRCVADPKGPGLPTTVKPPTVCITSADDFDGGKPTMALDHVHVPPLRSPPFSTVNTCAVFGMEPTGCTCGTPGSLRTQCAAVDSCASLLEDEFDMAANDEEDGGGYEDEDRDDNRSQRYRCYRRLARQLGYTFRAPLPNCLVLAIRALWPDPHGRYTGYRP